MRKFFLLVCLFLFGLTPVISAQGINIKLDNVTVKEAISSVSQEAGYTIVASSSVVDLDKKVTINAKGASIKDVIDQIFAGQDVVYTIEGKSVKVSKKAMQTKSASKALVACKGTVVDTHGEPVIGAAVIEQSTNKSCITDLDGNFTIIVKPGAALKVINLGFSDMEVRAAEKMNIVLKESSEFLDEVVVVGYGTQKRKDLTGAITHVDVLKAQAEAPRSVGDLLRGKATGLQMWQGTDVSGHINGVKVRTQNTLSAGSDAAIVLDGSLFHGFLSDINPADIESIDVLKDAAACAVYGANGASGVILITTKKGETGKPKVNFNANVGVARNVSHAILYDGEEFLKYREDMLTSRISESERAYRQEYYADPRKLQTVSPLDWYNYNVSPKAYQIPEDTDLVAIWLNRLGLTDREVECYENGITTDWESLIYPKAALQQEYQVSASNRNEKCSYLTSIKYTDKEGAVTGMGYKALSGRINIDTYISKWLSVGTNAMLSFRDKSDIQVIDTRLQLSPYTTNDVDDPNSPYRFYTTGSSIANPFLEHKYMEQAWHYLLLNTIFYAQISLPFGIQFRSSWSPTLDYMRQFWHKHTDNILWTAKQATSYKEHNEEFFWQLDNLLSWGETFGDHRVEATLLQTAEKKSVWNTCLEGADFSPTDKMGYNNIYMATKQSGGSDTFFTTGLSYMGRVFYQYKGRYMFNASIRRDGWSAFGKNKKFGNFPAASLGWTFSEEPFLQNTRWLDFGKLRLSYGINGNRNIPDYAAVASVSTGRFLEITPAGDPITIGTLNVGVANTDLQWEETAATNIGLDLSLFDKFADISFDLWRNTTTNLLVKRQMLTTAGYGGQYDTIYANLGELKSHGMDLTVNLHPIRRTNFYWDSNISFYTSSQVITHLYGGVEDVLDDDGNVIGQKEPDDPTNGWYIGHNSILAYEMDGVWQLGQEEEAAVYGCVPGDFRYVDQNGDGVLNEKDKIFTGMHNHIAPYTINFQNTFNIYRDLTLSFLIYAKLGLWGEYNQADNSSLSYNYYKQPVWTEANPRNDYARYGSYNIGTQYRSRSFARVENVTLSYSIPKKIIQKSLFSSAAVSLTVRNPLLITKFPTGDPENYRNYGYAIRTFNLGLNFSL